MLPFSFRTMLIFQGLICEASPNSSQLEGADFAVRGSFCAGSKGLRADTGVVGVEGRKPRALGIETLEMDVFC